MYASMIPNGFLYNVALSNGHLVAKELTNRVADRLCERLNRVSGGLESATERGDVRDFANLIDRASEIVGVTAAAA